jgi:hypothetical protein
VAAAKPILTVFLKNKQLPGVLAKELAGKTIPDLVAVEGIRMVTPAASRARWPRR